MDFDGSQNIRFYKNKNKEKMDTKKWIGEIKNDLELTKNTQEDVQDKAAFRL